MRSLRTALLTCAAIVACTSERAPEAPAEQAVREAMQDAGNSASQPTVQAPQTMPPATAPPHAGSCGRPIIDGDGLGGIRIGMTADTVKAHCTVVRDTMELRTEGQLERILVVAFDDDTANVEISDGRVWRIEITDSGLRTADWLGVGTPLATLLAVKGGKQGLTGEGNLFLLTEARCGLSFELSEPRSPMGDWPIERLRTLPPSTVVKRVLVIGCRNG